MPPSTLAERIRANGKSRSPVQDTVAGLYDTITAARADGCSWRDLHAQLTREGHRVGKKHNSLYTAYHQLKARRQADPVADREAGLTTAIDPRSHDRQSQLTNTVKEKPTLIVDSRRRTTSWGKRDDD